MASPSSSTCEVPNGTPSNLCWRSCRSRSRPASTSHSSSNPTTSGRSRGPTSAALSSSLRCGVKKKQQLTFLHQQSRKFLCVDFCATVCASFMFKTQIRNIFCASVKLELLKLELTHLKPGDKIKRFPVQSGYATEHSTELKPLLMCSIMRLL